MTAQQEVQAKIIEVLKAMQAGFGDSDKVTAECQPLRDLLNFDSLVVPGAVFELVDALSFDLPETAKIQNIFADNKRRLTVSESAARFCSEYNYEGKSDD